MLVAIDVGDLLGVLGGDLLGLVHGHGVAFVSVVMVMPVFVRMVMRTLVMSIFMIMLVFLAMIMLIVRMIAMIVSGKRERMNDLVLVLDGLVKPGVVTAATGDDDVSLVGAGDVRGGGLEVVWVHAVTAHDGVNVDVHVGLRGVDDRLGHISPDGGRGDDLNGLLVGTGIRAAIGVIAAGRTGGERSGAQGGCEEESGGTSESTA